MHGCEGLNLELSLDAKFYTGWLSLNFLALAQTWQVLHTLELWVHVTYVTVTSYVTACTNSTHHMVQCVALQSVGCQHNCWIHTIFQKCVSSCWLHPCTWCLNHINHQTSHSLVSFGFSTSWLTPTGILSLSFSTWILRWQVSIFLVFDLSCCCVYYATYVNTHLLPWLNTLSQNHVFVQIKHFNTLKHKFQVTSVKTFSSYLTGNIMGYRDILFNITERNYSHEYPVWVEHREFWILK